jgi:calcium-translocating P-type ATPase
VRQERTRQIALLASNFTHTLALLLWFAAGLSFAAGIPELGGAVVAVIVVNGVFAFLQEYRASKIVSALMRRIAVRATVRRDGELRVLLAHDLVPGDIVHLAAGDIIPADCVLLEASNFALDLSMITGESLPVERRAAPIRVRIGEHARPIDLTNFAPGGAAVVTGTAGAVVCATGIVSTLGAIASMVEEVERGRSVLERQVAQLSRLTAVLAVFAGTATLVLAGVSTDVEFVVALTFATGVIVALVPEGLLPTLSVSLAIGAERMAARGAAIRRLSAVEAIGSVTFVCTDKTGTLTENSLSVKGFIAKDGGSTVSMDAHLAAALCNDAYSADGRWRGDAIDVALAQWTGATGEDLDATQKKNPRVSELAFDATRRYMSVVCDCAGSRREFAKGAPEAIVLLAGTPVSPSFAAALDEATAQGERVLALAVRDADAWRLLGAVRLHDPPRVGVREAITACRKARVRVVMLTGDHAGTASAVARDIGLMHDSQEVLDGASLDTLDDAELLALLREEAIFARIDPRQKLRIATLLRSAGEIVVVTGDGINDAPALRAADVGVAMGRRGTEVAKQAADIILSDDNFATIVAAIEEGRSIKQNIRRFASYVFTSNVAELVPFLLYIFLPIPLPLAIIQVLAIDLGTDLLPAMALGAEAPSPHAMEGPPELPERPLLRRALVVRTFLFFGAIESALGIAAFLLLFGTEGWRPFESLDSFTGHVPEARTLTFLGIVAGQMGCLFAQRDGPFLRRLSLRSNRWIMPALGFEIFLGLLLIYVPGLNGLFEMTAVSPVWLLVLPVGATAFLLLDGIRRIAERSWSNTT